ncbi:hypothetical protein [Sodalis-like endosymbiont of Proechinophthirus fluctus]
MWLKRAAGLWMLMWWSAIIFILADMMVKESGFGELVSPLRHDGF